MKKWNKITINKSNNIIKEKKQKNFKDFAEDMGGYDSGNYYKNKALFFDSYLVGRYKIWESYLKKNLKKEFKTLSLASGRGINELSLISENFNITCSDIEIPKCYEDSKKLFGNFSYIKFNLLEDNINNNDQFDCIYSLSAFYIFSEDELHKVLKKISKLLKKNGELILDFGSAEDNLIIYFFNNIYLELEAYLIYYLSKLLNKKVGFKFDNNFGYRWKNKEIINFANKFGLKFIDLNEYDFLTELRRSIFVRQIIKYFPFTKFFLRILARKFFYIRIFKFKKI